MKRFCLLLALAVMVLGLGVAYAQSDSARIVGTVMDASGASISGATVTVTNQGTARALTAKTSATGNFQFSALPPGHYHIEAKQTSFKTSTADITLEVSQVQEMNFKLEVGSVETEVNVTGDVALVDTSTSSTGEVIQGRQVTELPLNGRNFVALAFLTPGVTRGAYGDIASGGSGGSSSETFRYSDSGGAAISVNGLRPQVNNFLLDGVDNNESLVNSIVFFPPAEAIQEFRVNTSVASAEFGRAGGAVVQTSIKSGSNQLHGSAFEFRRSGFGDAHVWNQTGPIEFKKNQFGATLGGAIIKNKLFFFGDYQGWRQNQPVGDGPTSVPTARMRTGDFSELLGLTNNVTSVPNAVICPGLYSGSTVLPQFAGHNYVYNPQTCLPFGWVGDAATGSAGPDINKIPTAFQNPIGLAYLNAFPAANITGAVQNNFQPHRQSIRNFDDFDTRIDFYATEKDSIFGRFSFGQDAYTVTDRLVDATHDLPSGWGSGDNFAHPRGLAIGYTHTFGQDLLNEFRFGMNRHSYGYYPPLQSVPLAENLGIPNANRNSLLGGMALIGGWSNQLEYTGDGGPYAVPQRVYDFADSLSWTHGKHTFKFGASIIKRDVDFIQGNNAKGYFWIDDNGYSNNYNSGHGMFTGYEVSELLAGFVGSYQIGNADGYYKTNNWETGYFAQDDWRVNNKLTLNLGLRYDLYTWPSEANNRMSNFDPTRGILVEAGTSAAQGYNSALIDTDKNNFAPRIGFAYDIFGTGRTVIRGGYGIFYFLDRGGVGNQLSENPDFNGVSQFNACPTATNCNGYRITLSGAAPLGSTNVAVATGTLPSGSAAADPNNLTSSNNVIYYPKKNPNSYVQQWNVQIQQALTQNTALTVAYVGTKMDDLTTIYNSNALGWFPNVGSISTSANIGSGNYNGLQTSLTHRMSKGLQYTASYTWSHTLDNARGGVQNIDNNRIVVDNHGNALLNYNYGNADTDFRHYFVGSMIYELPWGRGRRWMTGAPKVVDTLLGGWQINNIVTLGTGGPFDVHGGSGLNQRPNYNGGCTVTGDVGSSSPWFSCPAGAFTDPGAGMIGNLPRNYFHGPGYHTWDASIFKQFSITERWKTEFRVQAYNLTNTPEFTNPDDGWNGGSNGNFGKVTSSRFSSERQLEFALRVSF